MILYGLIGNPLGHSFSERYFSDKFRAERISGVEYRNFPLEHISELTELIERNPSLKGFNVTIPYKEAVLPYLTGLDPEAEEIGAVNCIKIEGCELTGYNTDIYGFRGAIRHLLGDAKPLGALVLGTGGASKAVRYVLKQLGIPYMQVSRSAKKDCMTYKDMDNKTMSSNQLIINTTPLGTFPRVDEAPEIPYELITPEHFLFDLVYNPVETFFMRLGKEHGAKVENGYRMLVGQAERSWQIWQNE